MKKQLIEILESMGYPVYLQGSLNAEEEYPESFFTFWNFETPEKGHYDNKASVCVWGFFVYFYSIDPDLVESEPLKAKELLSEKGFIFEGKPHDCASDEPTHTGVIMTCYGLENY